MSAKLQSCSIFFILLGQVNENVEVLDIFHKNSAKIEIYCEKAYKMLMQIESNFEKVQLYIFIYKIAK